jgi:hypothetical protein
MGCMLALQFNRTSATAIENAMKRDPQEMKRGPSVG